MEGTDEAAVKAETIGIVVRDQTGGEVHFKVKPHTKFHKIHDAYCQKKAVGSDAIRLIYDGTRLNMDGTPQQLEMEDGDVIDAVAEQVGGQHF